MGRNGAGKSTLLGMLAGRVAPDTGRVAMASGLRLGYLPQADQLAGTVGEIVFGPMGGTAGRSAGGSAGGWAVTGSAPEPDGPESRGHRGRRIPRPARSWPSCCPGSASTLRPGSCPAASGAGSRSPPCWWPSGTCCCSTSPPTTSTSRRSTGSAGTCATAPGIGSAPSSWSATTAGCSTPSASGPGRSTGARCTPPRAATRPTCSPRPNVSAARTPPSGAAATWPVRSSPGCSGAPGPGPPRRSSGSRRPTRSSRPSRRPATASS